MRKKIGVTHKMKEKTWKLLITYITVFIMFFVAGIFQHHIIFLSATLCTFGLAYGDYIYIFKKHEGTKR